MSDGAPERPLLVGVVVTLGVVATVAFGMWASSRKLAHRHLPTGPDVVHVAVTARDWRWEVTTPGRDGVLGTGDDVARTNELRVPVGRPVVVHLRTRDLVHGLFLQGFGMHQDVTASREEMFWFRATEAGVTTMVCSQMCGEGHFRMQGRVVAVDAAAWAQGGDGR